MAQSPGSSTRNQHLDLARVKAKGAMEALKLAQEASKVNLPGGWMVKKDHPPGVGWVLMPPKGSGGPMRYWATKPEAITRWKQIACEGPVERADGSVDDSELEKLIHDWQEPIAA